MSDTMADDASTTLTAAAAVVAPPAAAAAAANHHADQTDGQPAGRGHRQRKPKVMDDAAPVARPQRSRASRASAGAPLSGAPSADATAPVEDAEESPAAAPLADDSAKEREVVPIEHYGLEVDRILAWRYKNSGVVHRTADGTIATGGDVRAPFEGQEQHLHIHPVQSHEADSAKAAPAAAAATDSAAAAATHPPRTSSSKKKAAAAAASSAASAGGICASPTPAAIAAPAARETGGRAQSAAAKKQAREAALEAKAQAKAAKAAAKEAAAAGKRGRKRKKDDEPVEAPEPPVAAAAPPAAAPAAASAGAGATAPEKGKGRRPKFTPLSKEDALAAFQRTLTAARESAGLASQPVTGLYASKKERLANREAAELAAERREEEEAEREAGESSEEEEVEADADAVSSDDSEASDEDDEDASDDEGGDSDADGDDDDGRPSKRRRTVSAKAAASSAAVGGKRSKSKSKKAKEAAKKKSRHAGRPSTTAVRNALIAECSDKEFFVTLKGRSYLHAKWVDVYAFLQPPSSRVHEMVSRPTTALLSIGLPTENAEKESSGAGGDKQTSGTYTQLRIKLQRFLRSTPLPIPDDEELFLADFVEIDRILARKLVEVEESESDGEGDATAAARARGNKAQRRSNKSQRMDVDEDAASAASSRSASPVPAAPAAAAASVTPRSRGARSSPTSAAASPSSRRKLTLATFYLVKWQGLPYSASTWEHSRYVHDDGKVREFERRQRIPGPDRPELLGASATQPRPPLSAWLSTHAKMSAPDHLPIFKNGNQLRPWQIDGVNFLNYNWYQRKGCILADEMGLGKTVQVCAHILHMRSAFARGPFLVIVPLSTLPHWKREFDTWSDLNAITLQGSKADRDVVRTFEWNFWANEGADFDGRTVRVAEEYKFDVLICTYESILAETNMLAKVPWRAMIVDEAHRLKNAESRLFKALALFQSEHRLLMTGTPIQNNLDELWTLLNFIEPATFPSLSSFQQQYGVLEKSAQVSALQSSLRPFLLRRMKEDCAKNIPAKEETIIYCELTILQKTYYRAVYERNRAFLYKGCKTGNVPHLLNVVMQLRKVCSHPFLLPGVEDKETGGAKSSEEFLKALIAASGKLVLLDKLLAKLKRTGHRVLIFSQMKMILDLLEYYMKLKNYLYERIDGSIRGNDRQAAIDRFSQPGSDRFVFMLSTRAGGLGINLTAADTVIIYDSDFNPQNDEQAQARCHRIGQDKPVQVYRLVARGTYEMDMFRRASRKLGLDQAVLKKSGLDKSSLEREGEGADSSSNALSKLDKAEVESLLRNGAMQLLDDPEAEAASSSFCEADIDEILTSRTTVIRSGGNDDPNAPREASTFSQAVFASEQSDAKIDVNDKDFWQKLLPDESSANKLMEKLSDGSAYASKDARAQFLAHLQDHVREINNAYQQGESLQHVPLIIDILKVISSATPPPFGSVAAAAGSAAEAAASTAAAAAPAAPTPMDVSEEGAPAAAVAQPSTVTSTSASVPGWTREQIRQCTEWLQELSKPRRQRKVADRYTDLGMNGPLGSVGGVSGVQAIESAFKRRLYGRALNGMGGIVLTRKQRKSMAMTLLDMAGVLPFPKAAAAASPPAATAATADIEPSAAAAVAAAAAPVPPPTLDEQMAVWYMLRAQLDSSLRDRRLSELMGWMLSFVQLLISLSDAQDQPVFAGVLARLQACVPAPEQLAALEAAESKARRCRERHNAIKQILAQQYRQRIAAARKESNREAAAAAAQSAEPAEGETAPSVDAPVKLEGAVDASSSAAASPAPLDESMSIDGGSAVKLEGTSIGSLLETDIGTIRIDDLLREEGAGNTYTSSGKRIGRPTSLLTDDTATLIQFQPLAIRGNAPDVSPEHLQDEYDDAQEHAEHREEVAHYARYELSPLKVSFAHFPSLAEDLTFVKYLCKRTKRWARFMLLAQQLRDELDEFQQSIKAEEKEQAHVLEVVHRHVSDEQLQARDDSAVEEEEVAVIEGALAHAEKMAAAEKANTQDGAATTETDANAAAASTDAAATVPGSAAAAASTSSEFAALTPAQRKLLTHLGRAAVGEVRALPAPLLARLLRRTVVRTPPSAVALAQQGPLFAQLHIPSPLERLPAWWWTHADDKALLQGVARYGVAFNKIARASDLGFKLKLADTAFGDDDEGSEEDEPERGGSPTKARGKAAAAAAAADRKPTLGIKEEEAESAAAAAADSSATSTAAAAGSTSTSVHAAGNGCICKLARYARNMGRTRVCTSCNYWYHLSCLDDPARLKLANFLPLPAGHPLAPGLGSVAGPPGFEAAAAKVDGPDALARQRSIDSSAGDDLAVSVTRKVKAEADDEDDSDSGTDDEEESKPKARRGSAKASAAVHAPSASALRDSGGFRCPRCCMSFPGQRALELRLRVLADALSRGRRSRLKSRDKLLRVLDEQHHRPADSAAAPTSRARASAAEASSAASSSSAAALALWTKKERHEFQRSLQMYGSAFFLKGGYHAGVPVLEEAVRGAVAGSPGGSAALAHLAATPLLSRKTPASLRAYYERLMAQCQYLVERHRRDTTISALRRRQTALLAEHRELAEARGRLASLIQKERQSQAKYCFCKATGPQLRAAAAAQTRKKRPDEFLVGCDDGSSPGCRASGGWFHGLCMGIPNEAAVPDQWICPHCAAQRSGTEPVLPTLPPGDVPNAGADSAPITLAEVPASFEPLPLSSLFESSSDGGVVAAGDDSGSDSDAGPSSHSEAFNSLYSSLSLDDLEEEFNSRAELYVKDAATLRTEYASLKALVARPLPKAVVVDESLGHHLAYKILARVNLLQSLRDGLSKGADAVHAVLETIAAAAQSTPPATSASSAAARMPDWWYPPVHDWAILRAVFRHGLGSADAILADPLFSAAWHPTLDEPYLNSLVSASSGAKAALRREIDKFVPVFLQDRNPLLKRLATLGNWLNYGGPNNPNPAADLPFTAKRGKTGADIIAAASASASGDSGAAGAPASKSGEKARAPKLPLVAILDAKLTGKLPSEDQLANPDQSSDAEEQEQEEDEEVEAAASARSAPKRAIRKKKVTAIYVPVTAGHGSEESKELAAARELAMSQSNEKRRRSSSKRKMDAEADAEAIQEIALAQRQQRAATAAPARKRKSAPVASAGSDSEHSEAETDEAQPVARATKRKAPAKRKSATAAEEDDEGADESAAAAAPKQRKRPSARKAAPASSEDDGAPLPTGNVRSVAEVRRDPLTGAVLPFTVKGGIRIISLGRVVDSPLFRKSALVFPVGFTSTRPFHSVRHPGSRTEYTSRVLVDPSSDAPLFEVRAADDPDTVYAGCTASACWSAVALAAHNARGTEGRTAVSGLEYFGLSHQVVKALVAEMAICALPTADAEAPDGARAATPVTAAAAAASPSAHAAPAAAAVAPAAASVPLAATTLAVGAHPVAAALAHPSHLSAAYPTAHPAGPGPGPSFPSFSPPATYEAMVAHMYSFMSQQQQHAAAQSQQQHQQPAPHTAHIHAMYQHAAAAQLQQQRALQAATSPPATATATADAVAAAVAAASAAAADPNTMTDA